MGCPLGAWPNTELHGLCAEKADIVTVDEALAVLADDIASRVCSKLRAERVSWLDQRTSPAGSRRHIGMTKRRVQAGLPGAAIVGRRFLLSPEALQEELTLASTRAHARPAPTDVAAALGLQLVKGRRS
jgi:hypothetical protein